jgi:predicted AAA+ superfamily ATPase
MVNNLKRAYKIENLVQKGRVLVVYGPRRSGKTTLVQEYITSLKVPLLSDSGDNISVQEVLGSSDSARILRRVEGVSVYCIDEAQNVPNIGQALKIIVDARPDLIVIATGSSSFDLANKIGEPLLGRRELITLYPFALHELGQQFPRQHIEEQIDLLLTYGSYPQVYTAKSSFDKESKLQEIVEGSLLKDIFALEQIKAPTKLFHLVRLLAQYIGQPISTTKLSSEVGVGQKTVERYLDLLEKTFVIRKVLPFANKLSQSLKFKPKYYFYDLGIRNSLLGNFLPPHERVDVGSLWENFCYIERIKKHTYERLTHPQYYFYQSYSSGKEIDIIEEYNGYAAFECKWKHAKKTIALEEWDTAYPSSPIHTITRENYFDYLV